MAEAIDRKGFGRRVRERRKEFGWSQPQLAKESGQSQSNISWIELGDAKDPQKQAIRLAKALRLHLDWLLYETGPRETGPALPSGKQFGDIYDDLPIEGKEAVMAAAAAYLKRKKRA